MLSISLYSVVQFSPALETFYIFELFYFFINISVIVLSWSLVTFISLYKEGSKLILEEPRL